MNPNTPEQIKVPVSEINKDGWTEFLNKLLEQRNNEPLSNMEPKFRNIITKWNFDKNSIIKNKQEGQDWYEKEWNLSKMKDWISELKNQAENPEKLKEKLNSLYKEFLKLNNEINTKTDKYLNDWKIGWQKMINEIKNMRERREDLKVQMKWIQNILKNLD